MAKAKIMIVEDEWITADDIKMSLQSLGYAVTSISSSGNEAIQNAEKDKPDLVLMDIVLQGEMDGIEAANQIHSRFNIPIIYLTAHADEKILERAKITEPFGYIVKPFLSEDLKIAIKIALYKHRAEKKRK
jgi:CheY-like chemotaxis protein